MAFGCLSELGLGRMVVSSYIVGLDYQVPSIGKDTGKIWMRNPKKSIHKERPRAGRKHLPQVVALSYNFLLSYVLVVLST